MGPELCRFSADIGIGGVRLLIVAMRMKQSRNGALGDADGPRMGREWGGVAGVVKADLLTGVRRADVLCCNDRTHTLVDQQHCCGSGR